MTDSQISLQQFLSPVTHIIFDCDGVLYRGKEFFKHTLDLMRHLAEQNPSPKKLYFLTNNSTKSRKQYKQKFLKMGFNDMDAYIQDVYSSSFAAALYMRERVKSIKWHVPQNGEPQRKRGVFVIGMDGIREELSLAGIESFGYEFADRTQYSEDEVLATFKEYQKTYDIKAVLVGYDTNWNMFKLAFASLCIREIPGCIYVVTNTDRALPWRDSLLPGSGTIVESINVATQRQPEVICGKPNTLLLEHIAQEHNLDKSSILMVGDRLETDIRMARRAGILSMAVLSGAASEDDIANAKDEDRPDFVISGLDEAFQILNGSGKEE